MKRIVCAVLVFALLFCRVSFGADTFCQNTTPGTVVVFGNGIMNTQDDAVSSKIVLEKLLKATLSSEEFSKLQFGLAYNESYGFFEDLYESAKQKLGADNVVVSFWRWLGNQEVMPDVLQTELKAMAARFDFATRVAPEDLNNHILLYRTSILEGKKVMVECHSQGCLFANAAYEKLFTGSNALTTTSSFGIVAVATPASFTAGGGPYTTLVEDLVIQAIALATPPGVSPPRFSNITNIGSGATSSDWKGHGYLEEYTAQGSRSIVQVMNDTTTMLRSLVQPPQVAQPGAITATLEWGAQPDVDLHAFEDFGVIGAHVYYNNMAGIAGRLDVDDVYQYGPEHYTVSCDMLQAGTYHIGVNYYYGALPEIARIQIVAGTSVRSFTRDLPAMLGQAGNDNPVPVADIVVTGDQQNGFLFDIREVVPSQTPTITFGEF